MNTSLQDTNEAKISALDTDNPFVGLRPYEADESSLFWKR